MSEYGIFWGGEVLAEDSKGGAPLIDRLLWEDDTIFVLGKEKVGKSIFTLQMACVLTTGEDFLDTFRVHRECEIAYVQTEGKRYQTQDRLRKMMRGVSCNLDKFTHIFQPSLALDTKHGIDTLTKLIEEHKRCPDVIFIDPLYTAMGGDMKDGKAARAWIGNVRNLAGKYGAALVIVHHTHRQRRTDRGALIEEGDDAIYGSFVWKAYADHLFMMSMRKKELLYTLTCDTQRSAEVIEKVEFKLHQPNPLLYTVEDLDSSSSSVRIHKVIQDKGEATADEIEKTLEVGRATVYRGIRNLLKNGMVGKREGTRPIVYQCLNT